MTATLDSILDAHGGLAFPTLVAIDIHDAQPQPA